jgi:hypothetical protein
MIEISKILSKDFLHVRVDLFEINNKIYFSELTFTHYNGIDPSSKVFDFVTKFNLPEFNLETHLK